MARRFTKRRGKTVQKSGGWGGTLSTVARVASTALKLGKFAASVLNVEKKYFDTSQSSQVDNTNLPVNQCLMAQGTTATTRIGNSVKLKSMQTRFSIYQVPANTNPCHVRCIIYQDTSKSTYTTPAVADILEVNSTTFVSISPYSMNEPGRWKILLDKTMMLSPYGQDGSYHHFDFFHKFGSTNKKGEAYDHLQWDETGSGQADMRGYPIYILTLSDDATNGPLVQYYNRLRFIDN